MENLESVNGRYTVTGHAEEGREDDMKASTHVVQSNQRSSSSREFYTVSQIAELLQLTEMTIYRMIHRGDLPCYVIGRNKRFRSSDLEAFLASRRLPASGEKNKSRTRQPIAS